MAQFSYIEENYFLLFIVSVPLVYYMILKQFKAFSASKTNLPYPPGPTAWPIIGNAPQMFGKMRHVGLADISRKHGPLTMIRLGAQNMIIASSPAAAKEILKTHDRLLSTRYIPKTVPLNQEELDNSSIAMSETCGERWKYLRTLCRAELFSVKRLDAQSCLREKKMLEMIDYVKKTRNDAVNIKDLVLVTLFNTMSNLLFSSDLIRFNEKDEDGGFKGLFKELFVSFSALNISDLYPLLSKFDLQGVRKTSLKVRKKIESVLEPIIQGRREKGASLSPNDFLDVLFINKFTNSQIQQLFIEFLSAGIDGIATTIEWAMAELMKNPKSIKKLIQELDVEIGTDQVKESHLTKLSYLQACIKETFRIHPPGPLLLPHRAPETCHVMNYTIPKNAHIYINIWAMGRDSSIWDEPLLFKPERFLNVDVDYKGNNFEFIIFGSGRRICPGLPLAGRQLPLILATLLHSFDWSLPNRKFSHELNMSEKTAISLQKEQPLLLVSKPRK